MGFDKTEVPMTVQNFWLEKLSKKVPSDWEYYSTFTALFWFEASGKPLKWEQDQPIYRPIHFETSLKIWITKNCLFNETALKMTFFLVDDL